MSAAHLDAARAWLAQDPDSATRDELTAVIDRAEAGDPGAIADLADRFDGRLAFGTAGLRGALGAGSNRMNRVLVGQAAAGFAAYLRDREPEATPSVVIGYDGRRNSDVFARDSAEIFAGAGLRAILLPRLLPTPVLAFAVRHLGASAGVMVTASHNPPDDNGYKVYLGGAEEGAQIVSPADAEIAAHIQAVADRADLGSVPRSEDYEIADESVVDAYVAATALVAPAPAGAAGMPWVYTAMHGVGWATLRRILETAGYPLPTVVAEQIEPDGRFPTVAFPNPEEPGAMDLSYRTATAAGAEFILANDPDADRLAVAIPDATAAEGWRRLTGNEVGLLLGWRAARTASGGSLACSLVSSPGLQVVAEHHGLDFHATLTGFKWISRAPDLVFGFEEALGYLVNPETVRDKDGISAAVAMLGLIAQAREDGETLAELLARFSETFGFFASGQVSIRVDDVSVIGRIMAGLRAAPPAVVGTVAVDRIDDLLEAAPGQPSGDVLRFWLADGSRVIVRPSGTEPKLKAYLDVRGDSAADAAARLAALEAGARVVVATPEG
ncbi:phospho-sugar mutase [Microbacterium sp.]|uniref:phospho-sugar mutase n=1 Tax=Microbacterium sp. TaxID=51671 RepID=UPI0037364585